MKISSPNSKLCIRCDPFQHWHCLFVMASESPARKQVVWDKLMQDHSPLRFAYFERQNRQSQSKTHINKNTTLLRIPPQMQMLSLHQHPIIQILHFIFIRTILNHMLPNKILQIRAVLFHRFPTRSLHRSTRPCGSGNPQARGPNIETIGNIVGMASESCDCPVLTPR